MYNITVTSITSGFQPRPGQNSASWRSLGVLKGFGSNFVISTYLKKLNKNAHSNLLYASVLPYWRLLMYWLPQPGCYFCINLGIQLWLSLISKKLLRCVFKICYCMHLLMFVWIKIFLIYTNETRYKNKLAAEVFHQLSTTPILYLCYSEILFLVMD